VPQAIGVSFLTAMDERDLTPPPDDDQLGDWRVQAASRLAKDLPAAFSGGPSHKAGTPVHQLTYVRDPKNTNIGFVTPSAVAMALNIAIQASVGGPVCLGEDPEGGPIHRASKLEGASSGRLGEARRRRRERATPRLAADQRGPDGLDEPLRGDRLLQHDAHAEVPGFRRQLVGHPARVEDQRRAGSRPSDRGEQVEARDPGEMLVGHHDRDTMLGEDPERLRRVDRPRGLEPGDLQRAEQGCPDRWIILDQQDRRPRGGHRRSAPA
jgi:hypothetical protein